MYTPDEIIVSNGANILYNIFQALDRGDEAHTQALLAYYPEMVKWLMGYLSI